MTSTDTKNNQNSWRELVAGAVAGIAARTVTSPIDVLKIRLQVQESKNNLSLGTVTSDLLRNEGFKALWKGNSAGIVLYASYNAIQFSVYSSLSQSQYNFGPFVNGGIAALTATSLTYPFDLIRTRMSISKNGNNIIKEINRISRFEGFKGLFKGYFLTIGQVVPYMGCIFATHQLLSNYNFSDFISGAAAGFICKTLFMPFDVFRRRLQLFQTHPDQFCLQRLTYTQRSLDRIDLLKKMWKSEGPKAFFRGWSMAVIKSTPVTAVTFSVYKLMMYS